MGILNALFPRSHERATRISDRPNIDDMQRRTTRTTRYPAIFDYIDTHPRDGYPDSPRVAFGSRYMGVQALSLRNPDDNRYLLDSHGTPIWLRTTARVSEAQRVGNAVSQASSPYGVQAAQDELYSGVPRVGAGPGTMLVVPMSQISD